MDKNLEKIYMKHRSNPVRPHSARKGSTLCVCSKCVAYRDQFWGKAGFAVAYPGIDESKGVGWKETTPTRGVVGLTVHTR